MLNVTLICTGQLRESYFKEAAAEYEKRLGAFCRFRCTELTPTANTTDDAMAQRILQALPERAYKIALCVEGKELSSPELSELIEELPNRGYSEVVFLIGGSDGLPASVKEKCALRLSFSRMTFPHQLMRVFLTEQIYRAFTIAHNGKYHK